MSIENNSYNEAIQVSGKDRKKKKHQNKLSGGNHSPDINTATSADAVLLASSRNSSFSDSPHKLTTRSSHIHSESSTPLRYTHSYDKYFSTTSLCNLGSNDGGARSPLRRPKSHHEELHKLTESSFQRSSSTEPNGTSEDLAPLLLRTGSRVWEDIQKSKGQSWLGTRESSTNLYDNADEGIDSSEEDEYSRVRNELSHRSILQEDDEDFNPLEHVDEEEEDDDEEELGIGIRIGKGFDIPKISAFADVTESLSDGLAPLKPSRNKVIEIIDWFLGVGQQESEAYLPTPSSCLPSSAHSAHRHATGHEQGSNFDTALSLGIISFGI